MVEFQWFYYRAGKRHLTKKAKSYLSQKAVQRVQASRKLRTRQQVAYNSSYRISLRAISFNHKFSEAQLKQALEEFLDSNEQMRNIPFDTEGIEDEEIDEVEDSKLSQSDITIELNIRGRVTLVEI